MACKSCNEKGIPNNNSVPISVTGEPLECINGHVVLYIERDKAVNCGKYFFCKKAEKKDVKNCTSKKCTDFVREIEVEVKCPICHKTVNFCFSDCAIKLVKNQNPESSIGYSNIEVNKNIIKVNMIEVNSE